MWSESYSVMSDSLQTHGLYSPWNSSGQNTGVGSLSLFQGIFLTQESFVTAILGLFSTHHIQPSLTKTNSYGFIVSIYEIYVVNALKHSPWLKISAQCMCVCVCVCVCVCSRSVVSNSAIPSSIHGVFQAIVLEWAAISFSRGSSQPRDRTWVSHIVDICFTVWATKEVQ